MTLAVVAFEGPVGVGKTTLGTAVSARLKIGFVDGDEYSLPGPWLRSILKTSHRIAFACQTQLERYPAVIMAYPLRCTNWLFFRETFQRHGIAFHCIGLTADLSHISNRERVLTSDEVTRTSQMLAQGYGRRPFSDSVVRTDEVGFELTCDRLAEVVSNLIALPSDRPATCS